MEREARGWGAEWHRHGSKPKAKGGNSGHPSTDYVFWRCKYLLLSLNTLHRRTHTDNGSASGSAWLAQALHSVLPHSICVFSLHLSHLLSLFLHRHLYLFCWLFVAFWPCLPPLLFIFLSLYSPHSLPFVSSIPSFSSFSLTPPHSLSFFPPFRIPH